jgi:hypothetical protein
MGDTVVAFFDNLAQRGVQVVPARHVGTIRFDLSEGQRTQHWRLKIEDGNVTVSRDNHEADCVMHASFHIFDEIVTGEQTLVSALIRGAFDVEGDLSLLAGFRRLLPGPPGARDPRSLAPQRRRTQ